MAKAYSKDLRIRIVDSYQNHEGSMRKLAERYKVSKNFIYRLLKHYRQEGSLSPKAQGGSQPRIQRVGEKYLRGVLKAEPGLGLKGLRDRYSQAFGDDLGLTTLHDSLTRWGISRKKNRFTIQNQKRRESNP